MPIDTRQEELHTLEGIRQFLPKSTRTGNPPHPSVVFRWVKRGLKAGDGTVVRLEALKCGSKICTSREAIDRFFNRLTALSGIVADDRETTSRKLVAKGLKVARAG